MTRAFQVLAVPLVRVPLQKAKTFGPAGGGGKTNLKKNADYMK
jgi:hypothetical protein